MDRGEALYRSAFKPRGLATAIGSLPHTDPDEACSLMLSHLPDIPVWPQLPRRSFLENMYAQYSEGFPGLALENERLYVQRSVANKALERLYAAYLENAIDQYDFSPDYAAGLHAFLARKIPAPLAVKGQVTGPISWGLAVTDEDHRPIIYDDVLADAVAKHLRLKATWQERALKAISPNTIIFLDEPYLASFGSAFISLSREKVINLLEEVFQGITGLKGVHCCGNTDWSVVLATSVDILNLDAYNYGQTISLYPAEVKAFLERGGIIAWGIVPSEEKALAQESQESLWQRLMETMGYLCQKGVPFPTLLERSLITPSCGLGSLSLQAAAQALEWTAKLSTTLKEHYNSMSEIKGE
ncbi:MAG: methionine synthase [Chloroflexi bacterium]|nr:methionine synthase [Chloroflexota bacterium]